MHKYTLFFFVFFFSIALVAQPHFTQGKPVDELLEGYEEERLGEIIGEEDDKLYTFRYDDRVLGFKKRDGVNMAVFSKKDFSLLYAAKIEAIGNVKDGGVLDKVFVFNGTVHFFVSKQNSEDNDLRDLYHQAIGEGGKVQEPRLVLTYFVGSYFRRSKHSFIDIRVSGRHGELLIAAQPKDAEDRAQRHQDFFRWKAPFNSDGLKRIELPEKVTSMKRMTSYLKSADSLYIVAGNYTEESDESAYKGIDDLHLFLLNIKTMEYRQVMLDLKGKGTHHVRLKPVPGSEAIYVLGTYNEQSKKKERKGYGYGVTGTFLCRIDSMPASFEKLSAHLKPIDASSIARMNRDDPYELDDVLFSVQLKKVLLGSNEDVFMMLEIQSTETKGEITYRTFEDMLIVARDEKEVKHEVLIEKKQLIQLQNVTTALMVLKDRDLHVFYYDSGRNQKLVQKGEKVSEVHVYSGDEELYHVVLSEEGVLTSSIIEEPPFEGRLLSKSAPFYSNDGKSCYTISKVDDADALVRID
jgi:hypothetical protein